MKFNIAFIAFLSIATLSTFTACEKTEEVIIDSSLPQGAFTAAKSGTFTEQNGTGSKGAAQIGTDADGTYFLKLGSDFSTTLATGTVTVFLSTSEVYTADPGNGNPNLQLIGVVGKNGEMYFKLSAAPAAKFTHAILWCASASIPFGYAPLN